MDTFAFNVASVCPSAFSNIGGELFLRALTTVITAHCTIIDSNDWPGDDSEEVIQKANAGEKYDFIVIGAGTAGSLVASELSNLYPKWMILLVEAGGDTDITSEVPAFLFLNQNTSIDWKYKVNPDGRSCLGFENNSCIWSKGKGMGGSSSINAMIYVRGHSKDFQNWSKGWEYNDLLPYFEYQEKYFNISHVTRDSNNEWYQIIREAWKELNFSSHCHLNEALIGIKRAKLLINEGKRVNTAKVYIKQAKSNLRIMKNTQVEKIMIHKNKAIGVKIRKQDKIAFKIMASKEVILSAGTIATPQLLMLSGIGPKNHLNEKNIPCILDLPVGQNLQDHIVVPLFLKTNKETNMLSKMAHLSLLQYMLDRTGPLSNIGITDFMGFINTLNSSDQPDVQLHHLYYPKHDKITLRRYLKGVGYRNDIVDNLISINKQHDLLGIYLTLLHPLSKGSVMLLNKQADSEPVINTNYLGHPDDVKTVINAIKFVRKLEKTKIFKNLEINIVDIKLKGCSQHSFNTDLYWKCYISHMGTTIFHPVGTAKMGDDETCVVGNDLLVRGLENLRVVDASIMPGMPGGNTMATTLVIAQKAIEIIKRNYSVKDEF